ncbi:MAG: hypothetical protein M1829_000452 [Trizodia sp. TS-e1964]|nr:MAG: hypothetical protein M1829_000452 [Trizodia sp. TS-e1964]
MSPRISESAAASALLSNILHCFTAGYPRPNHSADLDPSVYLICAEALRLEIWLSDQSSRALEEYTETLVKVLEVYEGLVKPQALLDEPRKQVHINNSTFTKLPTLCACLKSSPNEFELGTRLRELFFLDASRDLRNILFRLTLYNNDLSSSEETIASWYPSEKNRRPAYEVRDSSIVLYQTLSDVWPYSENGSHTAKLCLSLYEQQSETLDYEVDFDLVFSARKSAWLQSKVKVIAQVENEPETQTTVRFNTPPIKRKATERPKELVKDICKVIRDTMRLKSRLNMVVDTHRNLWRILSATSLGADSKNSLNDSISMTAIVEALQKERFHGPTLIDIKERRVIAILLSQILLHFCGTAWLKEAWNKKTISFLRSSDREQLVLSTNLEKHKPDPDLDARKRTHRFPAILSLGILIMELELKKSYEFFLEKFMENLEDDEVREEYQSDANIKLYVALDMLEYLKVDQPPESGIIIAIDACINFNHTREVHEYTNSQSTEEDDIIYHRYKLYSEISLRRKIFHEIIVPLERDFCRSFNINASKLFEQLSTAFSFWDRYKNYCVAPQPQPNQVVTAPRVGPAMSPWDPTVSIQLDVTQNSFTSVPDMQPIYFHDVPLISNAQQ